MIVKREDEKKTSFSWPSLDSTEVSHSGQRANKSGTGADGKGAERELMAR